MKMPKLFEDKAMFMAKLVIALRVVQGIFALLVLGLSASVIHWYQTKTIIFSPVEFNFLVFNSVWSLLSLAGLYCLPWLIPRIQHHYITFPLDMSNALFWLSGFAALCAFFGRLHFCRGSICQAARADVAFTSFSFALWTVSAVSSTLALYKSKRGSGNQQQEGAAAEKGEETNKEAAGIKPASAEQTDAAAQSA